MEIEQCLREIRGKAALIRYVASLASIADETPGADVFNGISDVCGDIEDLARAAHDALPPHALAVELKRRR